ncbi:MAG: hypothetical protein EPN36_03215 [Rhodanobacteraceae bacterium]|nr:MAG: hypothetical protein EPN36_03215 [Rhodanobacteraceae bacterium]
MKPTKRSISRLVLGAAFASLFAFGSAYGQMLQPNQTMGFSNGKLVKFTYTQNFDCVDQPRDDLDYNGVAAQSDSGEFQTPICQAGIQPTIDPTGVNAQKAAILYVLVPMFSLNDDQNPDDAIPCPPEVRLNTLCGRALGTTLIKLFGAIPEAYKAKPLVFTDCPNPGSPPGTCTMHASTVDLGKVLVALGKLPAPAKNVFLPTPNHSHVIANSRANSKAIWWEVVPVLVTNVADWPPENGSSGITSVASLKVAERKGDAIQVPSNFFLFFSSHKMMGMH